VLEDALERSLSLAAGMDTRGYGRAGTATPRERRITGALMMLGLLGVCAGAYALLDTTFLGGPWHLSVAGTRVSISRGAVVIGVGVVVCVAGMSAAGRRVGRTVYRPDPWRWPETAVALTGVVVGGVGSWVAQHQYAVAGPDLGLAPQISLTALIGVLIGLSPAVLAPAPRLLRAAETSARKPPTMPVAA
jgi:energy-coupling factor transport system permease protein